QAAVPETVLAMAQARLEALPDEERRVLRAASVYGERFRPAALAALLGDDASPTVARLIEAEGLSGRRDERAFRPALLRDAAYAMLTGADRTLGHRLAADWLERAGDTDALTLAGHLERGGERARAGLAYARAAEQSLEGADLSGVFRL